MAGSAGAWFHGMIGKKAASSTSAAAKARAGTASSTASQVRLLMLMIFRYRLCKLLLPMDHWIQFVGPNHALKLFDVRLIGINATSGKKLLFSVVLIVLMTPISKLLRAVSQGVTRRGEKIAFWVRQAIHLLPALVLVVGLVSIWFDNGNNFTMAAGMVTAGVAFALQKVITSFAAYLIILSGKTFNVGDRIVTGGVRGDVVRLGFMQTTIMEMGQPPGSSTMSPPCGADD